VGDDDLLQAAMAVRRGATRLARRLRMERPESAETLLELSVLAHLYRRGPMTPGALAAAERLQPQSLTRTLARLEREQLAVRRPDESDRRRSLLALTESGRLALTRDMQQRDSWLAAAMARELTPAERQLLRLAGDLMDRLAEADDPGDRAAGLAAGLGEDGARAGRS
jgi:DNA-binding MarR family transcriptional regulator